jgi:hypothetical protein
VFHTLFYHKLSIDHHSRHIFYPHLDIRFCITAPFLPFNQWSIPFIFSIYPLLHSDRYTLLHFFLYTTSPFIILSFISYTRFSNSSLVMDYHTVNCMLRYDSIFLIYIRNGKFIQTILLYALFKHRRPCKYIPNTTSNESPL